MVYDGPREPALNMALDEALLHLAGKSLGEPLLRIYRWRPSGVSLGRREPASDVDFQAARRLGFQVVRRPTGGKALLHAERGEVTYALVLPPGHPLTRLDVAESAARIAGGVAEALKILGFQASVGGFPGIPGEGGLCYAASAPSDVVVGGRKVSGSAQRRLPSGALLQHGTLLLSVDREAWEAVIPFRSSVDPWGMVAGLRELAGDGAPGLGEVYEALARGFSRVLGAEPVEAGLPREALVLAEELLYGKHLRREWVEEARDPLQ